MFEASHVEPLAGGCEANCAQRLQSHQGGLVYSVFSKFSGTIVCLLLQNIQSRVLMDLMALWLLTEIISLRSLNEVDYLLSLQKPYF